MGSFEDICFVLIVLMLEIFFFVVVVVFKTYLGLGLFFLRKKYVIDKVLKYEQHWIFFFFFFVLFWFNR